MKPLNIEERRKAFVQYLLMYLVSTALVVYAVYFVCGVPEKQNQLLLEKNEKLNAIIHAPDAHLKDLNDLNELVLKMDSLDYNALKDALDRVRALKTGLRIEFEKDSAILGNPLAISYLNAVDVLHTALSSKVALMSDKRDVTKLNRNYEKLKTYVETLRRQITNLQQVPEAAPILE
jgi:cell division protein FtsB